MSDSVQWAVLAPIMLGILLASIEVGLLWHARNVAVHAAAAAAEAEAAYGAHAGDGERAAVTVIRAGGLEGARVHVHHERATVRVRVVGRAPALIGLGLATIEESAAAPKERP